MKSCPKAFAGEKVGVAAKKNGKYNIIEYSELSSEHQNALMDDGKTLKFRHGSILIFVFDAKFLLEISGYGEDPSQVSRVSQLYHKAFKKIDYYDLKTRQMVKSESEYAWKFELFLQNFMPQCADGKFGVLEVDRRTEFAPIKNASKPDEIAVDSPDSARGMLTAESRMWLEKAGVKIGDKAIGLVIVSPLLSFEGENIVADYLPKVINSEGIVNEMGEFNTTKL